MTTEQKPLESGFGAKTTAREVLAGLDLTGQTAIVTGGYSGVGLETTPRSGGGGRDGSCARSNAGESPYCACRHPPSGDGDTGVD